MSSVQFHHAAAPVQPTLHLLTELEPWHRVFLRNLADTLQRREPATLRLTSRPAPFWPDVFVDTSLPRRCLLQSALWHVLAGLAIFGITQAWLASPLTQAALFHNRSITFYNISEYLPTIDSGSQPAPAAHTGAPALARQKVISLPRNPDNSRQTIVDPSSLRILRAPRPLPNLVAWNAPAPVVPAASVSRDFSRLRPIVPVQQAVQPVVQAGQRDLASLKLPRLPSPGVVEPAVSADAVRRRLGDLNISQLTPAAGRLAVAEQRSSGAGGASEGAPAPAVPPQPSLSGSVLGGQAAGRLIALGLDPVPASGPIEIPGGNRSGVFAAGPEGRPGAPGTPDIAGGGMGAGGHGSGDAGPGSGGPSDIPAGIQVLGGMPSALGAVVAAPAAAPPPPAAPAPARNPAAARVFASLPPVRLTDLARRTVPSAGGGNGSGQAHDPVFGPKKYYTMSLNMPNLTSAAGTWIMRFAELRESPDKTDVTAPEATLKVDPAYPPELIRDNIEGTVTLYAVIRADGTVSDVRVLRGVDHRLDENACVALSRWHFRPATKHGEAVDLEAVVQIPFRIRKIDY